MPMPFFNPAGLRPGDVVLSAVGNPWREDWPWERTEEVLRRPPGRIVTDCTTYFRNGRELSTWWRFWEYPRRLTALIERHEEHP